MSVCKHELFFWAVCDFLDQISYRCAFVKCCVFMEFVIAGQEQFAYFVLAQVFFGVDARNTYIFIFHTHHSSCTWTERFLWSVLKSSLIQKSSFCHHLVPSVCLKPVTFFPLQKKTLEEMQWTSMMFGSQCYSKYLLSFIEERNPMRLSKWWHDDHHLVCWCQFTFILK